MIQSSNAAVTGSCARSSTDPMSVMVAVALGLAAVWSMIALRLLSSALAHHTGDQLAQAAAMFDALRTRAADELRLHARMTAGDPRLVAALAAGGPDTAAVADLVAELARRRGTGVVALVAPDGRVAAEAGADPLRGLDLASAQPFDRARRARDAIAAGWAIGDRIVDLGIAPVGPADGPAAYLAIGEE